MSATLLAEQLERELSERHGPMISGEALRIALGYPSPDAFRQAVSRHTVPVPTFKLPHRRGRFALVKDLAVWLAQQGERAQQEHPGKPLLARQQSGALTIEPSGSTSDTN